MGYPKYEEGCMDLKLIGGQISPKNWQMSFVHRPQEGRALYDGGCHNSSAHLLVGEGGLGPWAAAAAAFLHTQHSTDSQPSLMSIGFAHT